MEKHQILNEIKRTAQENGGVPLGSRRFEQETGICPPQWRGRYWARWGDAVAEAGFERNTPRSAHSPERLIKQLADLTLQLGHFPTYAELRLARNSDSSFPTHHAFNKHLGSISARRQLVRKLGADDQQYEEVLQLIPADEDSAADPKSRPTDVDGHVYMLKLGKHYKIGRTSAVPRRHREISGTLPQEPDIVHTIATDDPVGIEAYWHQRFSDKRTQGEWFELSREDVRAFKRRRSFM